jgi:hypothetical protein
MSIAKMLVGGTGAQELYTPTPIIELVRDVLGCIDLDPASCEEANKVVQATRYYSLEDNGLLLPWYGKIFLNPPYARGVIASFVRKLITEYACGNVQEAILLVRLCSDTAWYQELLAYPVCFMKGRIKFYTPYTSYQGRAFTKNTYDNNFGSSFTYVGQNLARFVEVFSKHGVIKL